MSSAAPASGSAGGSVVAERKQWQSGAIRETPAQSRQWGNRPLHLARMSARRSTVPHAPGDTLEDRGEAEDAEHEVEIPVRNAVDPHSATVFRDVLLLGRDAECTAIEPGETLSSVLDRAGGLTEFALLADDEAPLFEASVALMQVMARACGHRHLKQFSLDDLTTWKRDMHHLTGVPYGGVSP